MGFLYFKMPSVKVLQLGSERRLRMIVITFPSQVLRKKAIGFLLGRFSGKILKSGELIVSEAAVEALAAHDFSFTVVGRASYEQQIAALRTAIAGAIQ